MIGSEAKRMKKNTVYFFGLIAILTLGGACRTRTVTTSSWVSPERQVKVTSRIYGAPGKAFVEESKKEVSLGVSYLNWVNTSTNFLVALTGADVKLKIDWVNPTNCFIRFYDYGKNLSAYDAAKLEKSARPLKTYELKPTATGSWTLKESTKNEG
ncbi:MAG: hypothetical protein ACO1QB_04820 [Verrucomicrobiales bacterium]